MEYSGFEAPEQDPNRKPCPWRQEECSACWEVMILQLAGAVWNSITWDEDEHIYAGYKRWQHFAFA
jgi:hypothetical protein